ncbi:nitroreductase family protein [Marinilabiliaceae bacterium ANBcel2]|nr:nitroreductase family protein [Marinilabiliaceae bacterium ANBcel2]
MKTLELLKLRQSVRKFSDKKISDSLIKKIIEAARIAPSAVNYQPWKFIIAQSNESLNKVYESYPREWFKNAKQIIIACINHDESWKRGADNKDHGDIDIAIAVDHITIMAASEGLGSCWVCNFDPQKIKESFNLPQNLEPAVLLPIGYPIVEPAVENKKRKSLNDILYRDSLSQKF